MEVKDESTPQSSENIEQVNDASLEEPEGELLAKSIKCDDCGKVFRTYNTVNFHATKTGHANFSESTEELRPLTDEEKKLKLEELRKKMAEKRELERLEDIERKKESERIRRKRGQELIEVQEKLKEKELQKLVESKKREAIEAKREKERIKAQIEQDRRDRIEREQRSKPSLSTTPSTTLTKPTDPSSVFASSTRASATTSKLQIRIPGATTLIETFQATDLLSQVYQCLESKGYSSASTGGSLATTYPRKVFTSEDRHKSLKELGLVPSNVLLFQP